MFALEFVSPTYPISGGLRRGNRASSIICALVLMGVMVMLAWPGTAAGQSVMRSIKLSWNPSPSENIAGYRLHYGQGSGIYSSTLEMGNTTTAEVGNLIEGTTYYFTVTAYTSEGIESLPSEEFHYMPNPALLLNVSARGRVQSDDGVMIVGFIVGGMGEKEVVVRALGPSLAAAGIDGALADPILEVHGAEGLLASNDSWLENGETFALLGLAPGDPAEPAVMLKLKPGAYTAVLRGQNGGTGIALLEVYDFGK